MVDSLFYWYCRTSLFKDLCRQEQGVFIDIATILWAASIELVIVETGRLILSSLTDLDDVGTVV